VENLLNGWIVKMKNRIMGGSMFKDTKEVIRHIFKNFQRKTEVFLCLILGFSGTWLINNVVKSIGLENKLTSITMLLIHIIIIALIMISGHLIRKTINKS
jgi:SNF family Na+-dependent transporter